MASTAQLTPPGGSGVQAGLALTYDPYRASVVLRFLRRLPPHGAWLGAAGLAALPVAVCLLDGGRLDGGHYSRWADLRALAGDPPTHWTGSSIPLVRDSCSVVLFLTIGLTLACLYYQWRAMAVAAAQLDENGVLQWHSPAARLKMHRHLHAYSSPARVRACAIVLLAAGAAYLLHRLYAWRSVWAALLPKRMAAHDVGSHLKAALYGGWWASGAHPPEAAAFILVFTVGLLVVLAQNASAVNGISALSVARRNATFHVDWLNLDGCYGWRPLRRIYVCVYCSMMLRAVQMSALLLATGLHETYVVVPVTCLWLAFLTAYVWLPYRRLDSYFERHRWQRIAELQHEFDVSGQSLLQPTPQTAAFLEEVSRIRTASFNPLELGGWQSWSFALVVLLPVALTAMQVIAT